MWILGSVNVQSFGTRNVNLKCLRETSFKIGLEHTTFPGPPHLCMYVCLCMYMCVCVRVCVCLCYEVLCDTALH